MSRASRNDLRSAIREADQHLDHLIAAGAPAKDIAEAFDLLRTLGELSRRRRRRFDLFLLGIAVTAVAGICGLASFFHSGDVGTSLSARTSGVIVDVSQTSRAARVPPVLSDLRATSLWVEQHSASRDFCTRKEGARASCEVVESIAVASLAPAQQVKMRFSSEPRCLNLQVAAGSLQLGYMVYRARPAENVPESLVLEAGDRVRLCANETLRLVLTGVTGLVPARWNDVPRAILPAIASGTLEFPSFGKRLSLSRTDVPSIDFASGAGPMSMELHDALFSIDIAGSATAVSVTNASGAHDARPVWLDWLLRSPALHGVLSLVGGLCAFAWSVREKIVPG